MNRSILQLFTWLALFVISGANFALLSNWFGDGALAEQYAEWGNVQAVQFLFFWLTLATALAFARVWVGLQGRQGLRRLFFWLGLASALVGLYGWAGISVEFNLFELVEKGHRFFRLLQRMWPAQWDFLSQIWKPLLDTLRMAVLGTFLGAMLSLPLIMLSTRTVTRSAWIYYPSRMLMGLIRTIPDLLYALLFVAAFGLGPIAGIPALALFSAGIIAKMTSESADNIDRGPLEAIEATGSGRLSMIVFAVIPQILPLFLSYTLYVFEINIRIAAVLAYVGAGGIGQALQISLAWNNYPAVTTVLAVILVVVFLIDFVSGRFRESLVEGKELPWMIKAALGVLLAYGLVWSALSIEVDMERISAGLVTFANMIQSMVTPDWRFLGIGVTRMLESTHIALIGTTISMFLAFPLGFFCAGNLGFPQWLVHVFRQIPNIIRTFPELILAIFFIASFGPGAFPGVLALAVHSVGMLSRLNYEIVETIDRGPIEALNSIGVSRSVGFRFAVLPQVIPEFIAMAIYRFEINVRAATVLGIVGAGGIGTIIIDASKLGRYHELGMYLLVVIVFVTAIDFGSSWVRRKIIEG